MKIIHSAKMIFIRLFGTDPDLLENERKIGRMEITVNGEREWLLTCQPLDGDLVKEKIKCSDDQIYKKEDTG